MEINHKPQWLSLVEHRLGKTSKEAVVAGSNPAWGFLI